MINALLHPYHPEAIGWADCAVDGELVKAFAGKGHEHNRLAAEFASKQMMPFLEQLLADAAIRGLRLEDFDFNMSVEIVAKASPAPKVVSPGGTE